MNEWNVTRTTKVRILSGFVKRNVFGGFLYVGYYEFFMGGVFKAQVSNGAGSRSIGKRTRTLMHTQS